MFIDYISEMGEKNKIEKSNEDNGLNYNITEKQKIATWYRMVLLLWIFAWKYIWFCIYCDLYVNYFDYYSYRLFVENASELEDLYYWRQPVWCWCVIKNLLRFNQKGEKKQVNLLFRQISLHMKLNKFSQMRKKKKKKTEIQTQITQSLNEFVSDWWWLLNATESLHV